MEVVEAEEIEEGVVEASEAGTEVVAVVEEAASRAITALRRKYSVRMSPHVTPSRNAVY